MRVTVILREFLLAGVLLATVPQASAWAQDYYNGGGDPHYRDRRDDDRRYDDRRDDRGRGLSHAQIVAAQEQYNRNVVSLQTQYNQGVVSLQQQFNRRQISRAQMDAGIGQLQRHLNDRIGQEQRALPH
jgi:hypothetical protein